MFLKNIIFLTQYIDNLLIALKTLEDIELTHEILQKWKVWKYFFASGGFLSTIPSWKQLKIWNNKGWDSRWAIPGGVLQFLLFSQPLLVIWSNRLSWKEFHVVPRGVFNYMIIRHIEKKLPALKNENFMPSWRYGINFEISRVEISGIAKNFWKLIFSKVFKIWFQKLLRS